MNAIEPPAPVPQAQGIGKDGLSIIRTGKEAEALRRHADRPARLGRYLLAMLGVVTAGAGLAEWVTTKSPVGLALGVFGSVLLVLGVTQHLLYRRDKAHWPEQAILWDDGIELVLHNGEVRGTTWSDSDLFLHLVERRAPAPANREYLLIWGMDSKIPPVELSSEGFERLTQTTVDHHLQVAQSRRGSRVDATKVFEIRQGTPRPFDEVGQAAASKS